MTKGISTTKTSKKNCAARLKKLNEYIITTDRLAAVTECNISYVTLSRYLNGQVGKLETGMKLVDFFTQRVSKREEKLNDLLR